MRPWTNRSSQSLTNKGRFPVEPRPPATIETNNIMDDSFYHHEDSQILEGLEDDDILQPLSTPVREKGTEDDHMETEPEPAPDEELLGPDGKLLKLRQNYKRISVSLIKAKAHLGFISSCKSQEKTPRSLKINVKCSAFLADHTNILDQFTKTTSAAEKDYVSDLDSHYKGCNRTHSETGSACQHDENGGNPGID